MHVVFRTDASLKIGTGHVIRCLTLANVLRARGAQCTFICRPHVGHLLGHISEHGHTTISLNEVSLDFETPAQPAHAGWLGTSWSDDADQTRHILARQVADWLVVDHYALDWRWEQALRNQAKQLMVIDDLADRAHDCEFLLDQSFGRLQVDYVSLVPESCHLLCGSNYALLRPDFIANRKYSLKRRKQPTLKNLLISMGGVDIDNVTGTVLKALSTSSLPEDCSLTIVMGHRAPWVKEVKKLALEMSRPTKVLVGVDNMAQIMADSDLAIGAAGSTSWERCCLGLPTITLVLADNQIKIAKGLAQIGATFLCALDSNLHSHLNYLLCLLSADSEKMKVMSNAASSVTDGTGVNSILKLISE